MIVGHTDITAASDNKHITIEPFSQASSMPNKVSPGTVKSELDLSAEVTAEFTERGTLLETYAFKNETDFDIYTLGTDLGI